MSFSTIRLILWDHLTHSLDVFKDADSDSDLFVFLETKEEATYVKHHKKKLVFLWSAQRHFANEVKEKGFKTCYVTYGDKDNTHDLYSEIKRISSDHEITKLVTTRPGDFRTYEILKKLSDDGIINVTINEDNRFYCTIENFKDWAENRKSLTMEYFYRMLRKDNGILMTDEGEPEGEKWNFDKDNRKSIPEDLSIPDRYCQPNNSQSDDSLSHDEITADVMKLVESEFQDHFGDVDGFSYAVTRKDAKKALSLFLKERLEYFGDYQDAMVQNEPWLFHSHISFYLNAGLLTARECVEAVESAYYDDNAPINAAEGFIRQILGWREYVRGIYWLLMPDYKDKNELKANGNLPDFFWSGDTKLNCLKQCIHETKDNAYAHHIQRLMVLGNFCLIAGIDPKYVNEWYMIVYADAHEWVELPNVSGMILFADGGYLGSKPYAASGSYINKMSDYCKNCDYNISDKVGESACPFNYLYWDFMDRNQEKLSSNRRLSMPYATYKKMSDDKKDTIRSDAKTFLTSIGVQK